MKGHKHTDRSRERRYNSGKSDDSSYPVIKTPSREDAVNLSDSDNDLANLKNNIMKETEMPLTNARDSPSCLIKKYKRNKSASTRHKISPTDKSEPPFISPTPKSESRSNSKKQKDILHITTSKPTNSDSGPESNTEQSLPSVKRSISITLPNKLNHRLRKRVHTTHLAGASDRSEQSEIIRIRSSGAHNITSRARDRKYSDVNHSARPLHRHDHQKTPKSSSAARRKHYSSFHPTDLSRESHKADLQDLVSRFNEVEKKNKMIREKSRSVSDINLPGISDLAERHTHLHKNRLLRIKRESENLEGLTSHDEKIVRQSSRARELQRGKKASSAEKSEIGGKEKIIRDTGRRGVPLRSKKTEHLETEFSKMRIKSEQKQRLKSTQESVHLSQSDSDEPVHNTPKLKVMLRNKNNTESRRSHPSKSYTIDCTKLSNTEAQKGSGSVQKIEIVPRKARETAPRTPHRKPRQRQYTQEVDLSKVSSAEQKEDGSHDVRTNNPAKTKSSSPRLRQTSEHPLTEEVQLNDGEEEVQDSMSDNLVRMIKQIDTQTLKRRLDLDKLDEHLDTDDESHLDRMLNQITSFVENTLKRRRVKTSRSASTTSITFGKSTVHTFDPSETVDSITSMKRHAVKPLVSILKKKRKT